MKDPCDDLDHDDPFDLIRRTPMMLDGEKRGHRRVFGRILIGLLYDGLWWRETSVWWKQRHRRSPERS